MIGFGNITLHSLEYMALLFACFGIPFLYTLIHRRLLRRYHYSLYNPSVLLAAIPFIIWDIIAVSRGYWSFNPAYTTPFRLGPLPVEEYLFFLLIPQSSLLIWVALKRYTNYQQLIADIKQHFERKSR